ncbi:uncharacterized protein METZ01_LOCUS313772, partial [marine metagenome]
TFIKKLLNDAEAGGFGTIIWLAPLDPFIANTGGNEIFRNVGLKKKTGEPKAAWHSWSTWAKRPYVLKK